MVLESDSSNFLAKNYERINAAAQRLMTQGHSQSAVFVVDLYASLMADAREVNFVNQLKNLESIAWMTRLAASTA